MREVAKFGGVRRSPVCGARPWNTLLIFTFVEWGRAVKSETSTYSGYLTVETWACAFSKQNGNNFADSLCKELQAARYLLIPVLVLGAMMLTLMLRKRFLVAKGVVQ